MRAVLNSQADVIKLLLDSGADGATLININGQSAVEIAKGIRHEAINEKFKAKYPEKFQLEETKEAQ